MGSFHSLLMCTCIIRSHDVGFLLSWLQGTKVHSIPTGIDTNSSLGPKISFYLPFTQPYQNNFMGMSLSQSRRYQTSFESYLEFSTIPKPLELL